MFGDVDRMVFLFIFYNNDQYLFLKKKAATI